MAVVRNDIFLCLFVPFFNLLSNITIIQINENDVYRATKAHQYKKIHQILPYQIILDFLNKYIPISGSKQFKISSSNVPSSPQPSSIRYLSWIQLSLSPVFISLPNPNLRTQYTKIHTNKNRKILKQNKAITLFYSSKYRQKISEEVVQVNPRHC